VSDMVRDIEARLARFAEVWPGFADDQLPADMRWLLAEVKRLLALELRWTTERPTVPGLYLVKPDQRYGRSTVHSVHLEYRDDGLKVFRVWDLDVPPYAEAQWCGPFQEPTT